mmetsp:Transcript_56860/g.146365  ORF Transcript_56860/g.146365 Transcript_56860/m.146365 type:complete len:257 (-) Transcript_56860:167-937(-)
MVREPEGAGNRCHEVDAGHLDHWRAQVPEGNVDALSFLRAADGDILDGLAPIARLRQFGRRLTDGDAHVDRLGAVHVVRMDRRARQGQQGLVNCVAFLDALLRHHGAGLGCGALRGLRLLRRAAPGADVHQDIARTDVHDREGRQDDEVDDLDPVWLLHHFGGDSEVHRCRALATLAQAPFQVRHFARVNQLAPSDLVIAPGLASIEAKTDVARSHLVRQQVWRQGHAADTVHRQLPDAIGLLGQAAAHVHVLPNR